MGGVEPASERAYQHLKHEILRGNDSAGSFLTEGAIAEELGISRTPVREALLRLQVEGMVELYPKKGAMVVPVTARETREVFEARELIETWAAERAWSHRKDALPRLRELLGDMRTAKSANDPAAFSEADRTFHEVIVDSCGNSVISRQYRNLRDRQVCIVAAVMRSSDSRMVSALTAHRELLTLLESGTKAAFVKASREHVTATGTLVSQ